MAAIGRRGPWWAPAALACGLLTVVPCGRVAAEPRALAGAIALYPVVGAALGAALGLLGLLVEPLLPAGPTAALLLATGVGLTGALHIDGLMDTADGVFGGRTPARRLEIMRDSRVGAYGAAAGVLALVCQYACLAELAGSTRLTALVEAGALSRWAMAVALGALPAAPPDGPGATFRAARQRRALAAASAIALAVAAAGGAIGGAALVGGLVAALGGGAYLTRRLGGLTGDGYGAIAVAAETLALYLAVAVTRS